MRQHQQNVLQENGTSMNKRQGEPKQRMELLGLKDLKVVHQDRE